MGAKILMVVAEGFRDEEYRHPKDIFEEYDIEVTTAGPELKTYVGKYESKAEATVTVADAKAEDYDAVVFVGGKGASIYFDDPAAHALAASAAEAGITVGAECVAPSILARAGLLNGRMATAWPEQEQDLREYGALYTGQWVTIDPPFVTSSGPAHAMDFGREMARRAIRTWAKREEIENPSMPMRGIEPPPADPGDAYGETF